MHPDLRAAIRRDGIVRAVPWGPHLELCGPTATLLETRDRAGVTLADLSIVREDDDGPATELIVEFLTNGERGRDALLAWATSLGYRRVWLPAELHELHPEDHVDAGFGGKARVRCTSCHGRLVDGTAGFWEWVRSLGYFPYICPLCGGDLPQWTSATGPTKNSDVRVSHPVARQRL